jgi:hypothetical protein
VTTALQAVPAFDEGGNFIRVRFEPIRLTDPLTDLPLRDFHLGNASPARAAANVLLGPGSGLAQLLVDFDGQPRPAPLVSLRPYPDMGADENPQ